MTPLQQFVAEVNPVLLIIAFSLIAFWGYLAAMKLNEKHIWNKGICKENDMPWVVDWQGDHFRVRAGRCVHKIKWLDLTYALREYR